MKTVIATAGTVALAEGIIDDTCLGFSGSGGYRSKKRRTNETVEIEDRLESLILRVGEKVSEFHKKNNLIF